MPEKIKITIENLKTNTKEILHVDEVERPSTSNEMLIYNNGNIRKTERWERVYIWL